MTFVSAFSEPQVRNEISSQGTMAPDYFDKFFLVSMNLPAPAPEMIGRCFQIQLRDFVAGHKWFKTSAEEKSFTDLLERTWDDGLQRISPNFRKAGLLINDVITAARAVVGEVNPFDLVVIEALRRFYPVLYPVVRTNASYLTFPASAWNKSRFRSKNARRKRAHNS